MKQLIILIILAFPFAGNHLDDTNSLIEDMSVQDVLEALGDDSLMSQMPDKNVKGYDASIGEDIVKKGFSKRKGLNKAKRQSKYFVCTSCHNIEREDPDLRVSDPQARLLYTNEKNLPFLQATSLYGVVNRTNFYNGDYFKKYGELVTEARNDIRASIQLCATECAQGRELKNWEMESIIAYLWEIDLQMKDLPITREEKEEITKAIESKNNKAETTELVKSKYLQDSPATFLEKPANISAGYEFQGDPDNGKLIYENSCLHCHYQQKYSFLHLDNSGMTFKHLNKKAGTYTNHSIYQVIRYGTYPKYGKKSYMPLYPQEKMNNQQVEDLRAYIRMKAS